MSSTAAPRLMLRRTRLLQRQPPSRGYASTQEVASNTASKGKEVASEAQSKASQGLSRVTSSAGSVVSGASQRVGGAVERIGGRTGRLINLVQTMSPPTIYYSKVGLELAKIVFRGQKMSPPDLATFQKFYEPVISAARNPTAAFRSSGPISRSPMEVLNSVRNMSREQMISAGVIGAEVLGFFTVGEMIGRMKLVGYRGEVHHEEH